VLEFVRGTGSDRGASGLWFGGGGVAVEQLLVHFQALLAEGPVMAADGEEHQELGVHYPVIE